MHDIIIGFLFLAVIQWCQHGLFAIFFLKCMLNEPVGTENLWISDQKMGVDGGAVFGGVLHGLLLDDQGIVHDHVLHNTGFSAADD